MCDTECTNKRYKKNEQMQMKKNEQMNIQKKNFHPNVICILLIEEIIKKKRFLNFRN